MKTLGILFSAAMLVGACGQPTSGTNQMKHNDTPVVAPANLSGVRAIYDAAVASGDMHDLEDQVANIDMLFVVPIDKLRQHIGLTPGFGQEYISYAPMTGASITEATQEMVTDLTNQGIAMLHNFHYIDAVRSFEQATRLDPDYADARIFLAMAYIQFSGDINGYLSAAKELAAVSQMTLSPVQEAWYKFAEAYVFSSSSSFVLQNVYRKLLVATNSDDEAVALAGWMIQASSIAAYEKVLSHNPNHVGANHYLVHLYEFSSDFKSAEPYGKKLAELSPMGGHAQHMYGHVLPMVKKLPEAIAQFEKTEKIHQDWAKANNYDVNYDWHYSHNSHLLGIAYLANNQIKEAAKALENGCVADFRACDGLAKMAVVALDTSLVDTAAKLAKAQFPASQASGVQAYFDKFAAEINYISGKSTNQQQLMQLAKSYQDSVLQVIASLDGINTSSQLYQQIKMVVDSLFQGGGFDSWTNGYPDAMRVRKAAEKFGLTDLVSYIDSKIAQIK